MSHSVKKTKIQGHTSAVSEKNDKRIANRRFRRIVKEKVTNTDDILPVIKEVSNVWDFQKDGKIYNENISKKDLRK